MASPVVKVHRNKAGSAISTNAATESDFMAALIEIMIQSIDQGAGIEWASVDLENNKEAAAQLRRELQQLVPAVVDICCKLRGYKSNVAEHRVLVAGEWLPDDVVEAFSQYRREIAPA